MEGPRVVMVGGAWHGAGLSKEREENAKLCLFHARTWSAEEQIIPRSHLSLGHIWA